MLFDSHAHYNDRKFDSDREEILTQMTENNVGFIMNAADSMKSVDKILTLCEKYPFMYASVGVHPEAVGDMTDDDIEILAKKAEHKKVRAVGEIGLDYYYDDVEKTVQKLWFEKQIELAKRLDLPVIIHDRDAHGDCMDILKKSHIEEVGGVMHCYSGSCEMAREVLSLGMYLGVGGVVTFKNAKKLCEVVKEVPVERLLIETDCPYLAPEPHRGEKNSSLYIHLVAKKIAELKGMTEKEVEEITCENAKRLYRIED